MGNTGRNDQDVAGCELHGFGIFHRAIHTGAPHGSYRCAIGVVPRCILQLTANHSCSSAPTDIVEFRNLAVVEAADGSGCGLTWLHVMDKRAKVGMIAEA